MASTRLFVIVVVLGVVGATSFNPKRIKIPRPRFQANINDLIDDVIPEIKNLFVSSGLDPLQLPDLVQEFDVTDLLGIVWHGELALTSGWLTDLSLLQRNGDAFLTYDNKQFNVSVSLAFPDIAVSYDFLAQIMNIGPEGAINGKVENLVVHIEAGGHLCDLKLKLNDLQILEYGDVNFTIDAGIFDFIENAILDVVTALFKGPIMDFVEVSLRNGTSLLLDNFDLADMVCGGAA